MNEAFMRQFRRSAELENLTSVELAAMLTQKGWAMGGRRNKTNRKFAVLHIEGYKVAEQIVEKLKLRRITDERTTEAE